MEPLSAIPAANALVRVTTWLKSKMRSRNKQMFLDFQNTLHDELLKLTAAHMSGQWSEFSYVESAARRNRIASYLRHLGVSVFPPPSSNDFKDYMWEVQAVLWDSEDMATWVRREHLKGQLREIKNTGPCRFLA